MSDPGHRWTDFAVELSQRTDFQDVIRPYRPRRARSGCRGSRPRGSAAARRCRRLDAEREHGVARDLGLVAVAGEGDERPRRLRRRGRPAARSAGRCDAVERVLAPRVVRLPVSTAAASAAAATRIARPSSTGDGAGDVDRRARGAGAPPRREERRRLATIRTSSSGRPASRDHGLEALRRGRARAGPRARAGSAVATSRISSAKRSAFVERLDAFQDRRGHRRPARLEEAVHRA